MMGKNYRSDIVFTAAVVLAIWAAYAARDVLLLIYVSALFAVVVSPAINIIRKVRVNGWRPGRGFAIIVLMGTMAMGISLFAVFALPPIYLNAREFATDWPKHLATLTQHVHDLPFGQDFNPAELEKYGRDIVGGAAGLFFDVAGGIFGLFTGMILTAYFIIDGERAFKWGVTLFPLHHQERLTAALMRAEGRMRKWLIGQGCLMAILGVCSFIVYFGLRIKYFHLLAMYACIANIVPVVGPLSAFLLTSTVAALDSGPKLVGVLIFYAIYQQLESAILSPRIMKHTVNLSPLAVIIALCLGGSLAGILGALVSVPTAVLVSVLADEYLVKRKATAVAAD